MLKESERDLDAWLSSLASDTSLDTLLASLQAETEPILERLLAEAGAPVERQESSGKVGKGQTFALKPAKNSEKKRAFERGNPHTRTIKNAHGD